MTLRPLLDALPPIPVTLSGLFFGVRDIRRSDVRAHAREMTSLFVLALAVTRAFILLPGRIMHDVVFADAGKAETP